MFCLQRVRFLLALWGHLGVTKRNRRLAGERRARLLSPPRGGQRLGGAPLRLSRTHLRAPPAPQNSPPGKLPSHRRPEHLRIQPRGCASSCSPTKTNPLAAPVRLAEPLALPRGRVGGNGQENAMEGLTEAVVVAALIVLQAQPLGSPADPRAPCPPDEPIGSLPPMVVSSTQRRGFRF